MVLEGAAGKGSRLWGVEAEPGDSPLASASEVQNYLGCHPVVARLLWARGLRTVQCLERFLEPRLANLPDPFSIADMRKASERVARAVASGEKIAVYGDYDVDGTCGAAVLVEFFTGLGVEVTAYQPNRFTEGYGVHAAAIGRLVDEVGARCILTVDCGITAVEAAREAKGRGADLIILDHHKLGAQVPEAYAIVNPMRPDDESGLRNLCGAGLAFFFAMAARATLRGQGYFAERQEPKLAGLLDLVAVATVADVMDIRGVNRILVTHGLRALAKNPRPGFKALMEAARIEQPTEVHIGFVIGPRINAAGRLQSAKSAFDLLTCTDPAEAKVMAQELEEMNTARRQAQDGVVAEAKSQAAAQIGEDRWRRIAERLPGAAMGPWPRSLVLAAPEGGHWHEGVVGIAASKVVEEFGRPAFILAVKEGKEEGVLKGSVRSLPKIDILAAISADSVARHLLNYGGHAHAGGVSLRRSNLEAFTEAVNEHLALTAGEEQYRRERRFDADIAVHEIDGRLVEELRRLGPFGHQFPEPVFRLTAVEMADVRVMKEKHLRLRPVGAAMDAVWFNSPMVGTLRAGERCTMWVSPQWNEFRGSRRLQLQIRHAEMT